MITVDKQTMDKQDATEFRRALGAFTTGVTVVTTYSDTYKDIGLTANSFNSVSLDPPMVLWSLAKSSRSLEAFKTNHYFAIHILSDDQELLSNRFAQRGVDKFSELDIERGPEQVPLLKGCAARFVCKMAYQYEGGDHLIFVGEVIKFDHWHKLPLLFHGGKYGQIKQVDTDREGEKNAPDDSLGLLLRLSYRKLIRPLIEELNSRNLTLPQHHFLAHIARSGEKNIHQILEKIAASSTAPTPEEIDDLVSRGYIRLTGDTVGFTEAGFNLRIELAARYKAIEEDVLDSIGYASAQSLKVLLGQLISKLSPDTQDL